MEDSPKDAEVLGRLGDYDLIEEIARGGMGIVYRARQRSLQREVAVKIMRDSAVALPEDIRRFLSEAAAAAKLRHPHIVAIHEVGEDGGRHYFAMDLIEGENLAERTRDGPLQPRAAAALLMSVAQAVQHAHECGILHRDLKPSNVLIDVLNRPFVTDFGLARPLDTGSSLTLTGQVLGTPGYMPPEQAAGNGNLGVAADIYSAGALLYHLLTGRAPFVGGTVAETLRHVIEQEPVSPRLLNPEVPLDLVSVCLKCLAKRPVDRYTSAASLAEDLQRFLRGEPTLARPAGRTERLIRWTRRQPALAGAIAAVGMVTMLGFAGVTWQWRRAERARMQAESNALIASENVYAADMLNTQQALAQGDTSRAVDFLLLHEGGKNQNDFRGWEWWYLAGQCLENVEAKSSATNLVRTTNADVRSRSSFAPISVPVFAPDNRTIAYGNKNGAVEWWDLETGKVAGTIPAAGMNPLAFADAGKTLIVAAVKTPLPLQPNEFEGLEFWNLETRTRKGGWAPVSKGEIVGAASISPDGKVLATGDVKGNVTLRRPSDGAKLKTLPAEDARVWGLVFSPDSSVLAIGMEEKVRLWTVATDRVVNMLGTTAAFAFSPDGKTTANGYFRQIRLSRTDGSLLSTFITAPNAWLAFSNDGKTLACADGSVELWNVPTGRRLGVFLPRSGAEFVGFSPDGRTLIGGKTGEVHVWTAATANEVERLFRAAIPSSVAPPSRRNPSRVPVRDPQTPRTLIDLSSFYNAALTDSWGDSVGENDVIEDYSLSDLTPGIRAFDGVQFDVRGLIQLGSRPGYPRKVTGIPVGLACQNIHFLHATMWGVEKTGTQIGSYVVHFANRQSQEIPLLLGQNIEDWWEGLGKEPKAASASPKIVWRGSNQAAAARGCGTRLFKMTWKNPQPDDIVEKIDFTWAGGQGHPFLIAITTD